MPRQARIKSYTGIYHIMIRGINKEKIFKNSTYKNKVIEIIREIKKELEFDLIAYCVMDNHMHLLLKADEESLIIIMKKINIKYAMYYNKLEKRYGHVFQDRFKSEAVEDNNYLLGALRYIHNNPIKAGMINNIKGYKWSSAIEYLNKEEDLVSEKYLNEFLGLFKDKEDFIKFHNQDDNILYIDTKEEEAEQLSNIVNHVIENFINKYELENQTQIDSKKREELAKILVNLDLITYRDIAELCNISYNKVVSIGQEIKGKK